MVPTKLAVLPSLESDRAVPVSDTAIGVVVSALDGPPEEGPAGGADLAPVVAVPPGNLPAHLTRPHLGRPAASPPHRSVHQRSHGGHGGHRAPPVYQDAGPVLLLHHLHLVLLILLGRQQGERLQRVERPRLAREMLQG